MTKIYNILKRIPWFMGCAFLLFTVSCEDLLEEEVYSELTDVNFYKTEADVEAALMAGYKSLGSGGWGLFSAAGSQSNLYISEASTDVFFISESWGGNNPVYAQGQIFNFMINSETNRINQNYQVTYEAIAQVNAIIDNVPKAEIENDKKEQIIAEAKSLRALLYHHVLRSWGKAPIIDKFEVVPGEYPEQPETLDEVAAFIENDLLEAIPILDDETYIGTQKYGRFTKAGAQALLAKLYLNTKQWQKAADMSKKIIDNPKYYLHSDYMEIFAPDNHLEGPANEMLVVMNYIAQDGLGNNFPVHAFHSGQTTPVEYSGWGGYYAHGEFYDSFDPEDARRNGLIQTYTTEEDTTVFTDRAIIVKYTPDQNAAGGGTWCGNDAPLIRLADIYLTRAEALNELNGPNQESIDLINAVRARAFEPDKPLSVSDFGSKEDLRAHILKERGWELYVENKRREDMIRHGVYISDALRRGHDAARDYHVHFPFPLRELEANPKLKQNPGY